MQLTDKILIKNMGFKITTHDRYIYCRDTKADGTILVLHQMDDFLISCSEESTAKSIGNIIGTISYARTGVQGRTVGDQHATPQPAMTPSQGSPIIRLEPSAR